MPSKSTDKRKPTVKRTRPRKAEQTPKPAPAPEPPKPAPVKHSPASLARRKATLISALKSPNVSPVRDLEIRAELAAEPMASTPILSQAELRRLDG